MSKPALKKLSCLSLLWMGLALSATAQSLQPLSTLDPAQGAPPGGSGDSWAPILSPDGRYVLFASTANNLMLTTNNAPIPALIPATLNVFLRDRIAKTTVLVSVNLDGNGGGDGDSLPVALSTNGQYALFESAASNLVPGDTNGATDVFLRDLVGAKTILVSANTNGVPATGAAHGSTMTFDGRLVAFVDAANDLVPNDTNSIPDIFVREIQTGATVLVSVGAVSTNQTAPMGSSESPVITPDGHFVAFYSTATNLAAGARPGGDVYARDLVAGTTIWASVGASEAVSNALKSATAIAYNQVISDDGNFVVYEASPPGGYAGLILRYNISSGTTELVHTNAQTTMGSREDFHSIDITPDGQLVAFIANTNDYSTTCVQLWDSATRQCRLLSGDQDGLVATNSTCDWPQIAPSGRFVLFQSSNPDLTTNVLVGNYHLYRRDLSDNSILLLDANNNGIGSPISPATVPSMSADASFVAFDAADGTLVPNDRNRDSDVFLRDVTGGTTELISAHDPSLPTSTANGVSSLASTSVSDNGRFVAFTSEADNLTSNDTNGYRDIFVRDLETGKSTLVSVATNGFSTDLTSSEPAISADGRYVAFTSSADNLIPGDTNHSKDVFVRDLEMQTTTLVSYNSNGVTAGFKDSYSPTISSDGRFVLFRSQAPNLVFPGALSENLYLRDMQASKTYALTKTWDGPAAMTPDGHYVAFWVRFISGSPQVCVWDSLAATQIYASNGLGNLGLAISRDGTRVVATGSNGVYGIDVPSGTNWLIDPNTYGASSLGLSTDGRWMVGAKRTSLNAVTQVYLYDLQNGTSQLISQGPNAADPPDGASDSCVISADGRLIAYRSAASNIVPGDLNGMPDIFVYDAHTGANTLLSINPSAASSPDNRSSTPVFSGDGKTLVFVSWASDLTSLDFNQSSDVFAYQFLSATILPAATPGQGPWLSWPYSAGKNYKVQFMDSLGNSTWQDVNGTVTNSETRAYLQDPSPSSSQRFYRIISD